MGRFFKGVLGTRIGSLAFKMGSLESEKTIIGSLESEKIRIREIRSLQVRTK